MFSDFGNLAEVIAPFHGHWAVVSSAFFVST